jgi:hypothetical protein
MVRLNKDENVDIYLKTNPLYAISSQQSARVIIDDNETPSIAWQKQLGTPEYDHANAVATDSTGNVYTTGRTTGNLAGTNAGLGDAFVNKFDDNGNLLWQRQLGTSGYDEANGMSVDDAGNVYLTGWTDGAFDGNTSDRDPWIAKYDTNGNLAWKKQLGSEAYDISNGAISVAGNGSIYITGRTYGNLGGSNQGDMDAWVAKYDSDGNQEWLQQLGTAAWDEAESIAIDADGNVYLTGQTQGKLGASHAGESDAWVAKYNPDGNQEWMQQLGTDDRDLGFSVAVNNQGDVYVSGQSYGWLGDNYMGNPDDWRGDRDTWRDTIHGDRSGLGGTYYGNGDAWVAQFDSVTGQLRWKRLLGTEAADSSTGVTVDKFGNVYLTGTTRGELVSGTAPAGGDDVFVAKYDEAGALQWKQQFGSAGEDVANGIAFNGSGLFFTGYTSMDLAHESQGKDDIWLMKLA